MTPCFAVWHTARTKEYRSRVLFEKGRMMAPEIIVAIVGASTTLIAAVARAVVSVRASRSKKKKRATGLASIETQMRARGSSGVRSDAAACIAADACACVIDAVRHARRGILVEDEAMARLRVHALGEIDEHVLVAVKHLAQEYARMLDAVRAHRTLVLIHTLPMLERSIRLEVLARVAERGVRYAGLTLHSAEHNRRAEELTGFVDVMRRLGVSVGVCVVEHRPGGAFVLYTNERAPLESGSTLRCSFDSCYEDDNAIAEGIVAQWTSNEHASEIAEFRLKHARTVLVMLRAEPREFTAATVDDATTELARLIHAVYENEHTLIVRCDDSSRVTGIVCSGPRAARVARGVTGDRLGDVLDSKSGTWRGEACTSSSYTWGAVTFVLVTLVSRS